MARLKQPKILKEFLGDSAWLRDCTDSESQKGKGKFKAVLYCGSKRTVEVAKVHSLDILYRIFGLITHGYFVIIITSFFFQNHLPESLIKLADSLSEPYLGVIGIYLVLKEVRARVGKPTPRGLWKESFVAAWVMLLFISSALTFLSQSYHVDEVFRLIITNSLASVIIRIGTLVRY
ncbi:MAG: hypothetical protein HYW88_03005 [Candidatus Sungbacteria bacterium]|nr:hypothetical protein [Candidatus Sungbacteria bacterium]